MSLREGASAAVLPAPVTEALERLAQKQRGPQRHRQPVAIIGPGDGGPAECEAAHAVAHALAGAGMAVVCGGRGGVMAAGDLLMYSVTAAAKWNAFPGSYAACQIVQSKLWPDAGVIGAAMLARDR